jgi:hypothetical protein
MTRDNLIPIWCLRHLGENRPPARQPGVRAYWVLPNVRARKTLVARLPWMLTAAAIGAPDRTSWSAVRPPKQNPTTAPARRRPWPGKEDPGRLVPGGPGGQGHRVDDHARQQTRRHAELGYVVLACNMFGRDIAGGPREQIITLLTGIVRCRRARA